MLLLKNKQVLNEILASKIKLLCEKALDKAQKTLMTFSDR